jgi:hypothetical protein
VLYSLLYHPLRVLPYLRDYPGLSRPCRVRLFAHLHDDLRLHGDFYRQDEGRRLAPGSTRFWYSLVLQDVDGDGRIRQLSFVVDDSAAAYGVLQVEYVQIEEGPG